MEISHRILSRLVFIVKFTRQPKLYSRDIAAGCEIESKITYMAEEFNDNKPKNDGIPTGRTNVRNVESSLCEQ